jgi:hypothetical protein
MILWRNFVYVKKNRPAAYGHECAGREISKKKGTTPPIHIKGNARYQKDKHR